MDIFEDLLRPSKQQRTFSSYFSTNFPKTCEKASYSNVLQNISHAEVNKYRCLGYCPQYCYFCVLSDFFS